MMGRLHAVASAAIGVLACLGSNGAFAADWPQFLGPHRDGHAVDQRLRPMLDAAAKLRWRRPAGSGHAGPVVANGTLYLFAFEAGAEVLAALDPATGKERWRLGYPSDYAGGMFRERGPRATPAVVGNTVVTFGADGVLQAVGTDGTLRWRRNLHTEWAVPESYFGASCSPVIHEELVLLK